MRLLLFIFTFYAFLASAQQGVKLVYEDLPLDSVPQKSVKHHSSVQPAVRWTQKQLGDQLVKIGSKENKDYKLGLNPVADVLYRYNDELQIRHGVGVQMESNFDKNWYFRMNAVAGTGNSDSLFGIKSWIFDQDSSGFNYLDLTGRVAYTPNQIFNFQAGLDHNFIGEGSRSLFLSDYGRPYPFAQIKAQFWRIEYTTMYQFMQEGNLRNYEAKFGATHHVSLNATKWLNFGIFESVIFQPRDTALYRGFDVEYLNPVIFYRPQEYSLGSSDNVLLGASMTAKWKAHTAYFQVIIDEFSLTEIKAKSGWWANKYGGQAGVKGRFDIGKWKSFYRVEYNFLRPYTYAHLTAGQNYGNLGMSLAHPYGANVMEILGELKLQKDKWLLKSFVSYFLQGLDKEGYSYGANVYRPYTQRPFEYGHETGQGRGNNGLRLMLTVSYQLSRYGNFQVFTEQHLRYDSAFDRVSYAPVLGLRNIFRNDYRNY
jgi:hypothetical protein